MDSEAGKTVAVALTRYQISILLRSLFDQVRAIDEAGGATRDDARICMAISLLAAILHDAAERLDAIEAGIAKAGKPN